MKTLLERLFDEADRLDREQEELEAYEAERIEAELNEELADLEAMSEDEACEAYNVDSKAEAELYIRDNYLLMA